jgi:DNA-binding winged helix-turn-helix (wHTH) protein
MRPLHFGAFELDAGTGELRRRRRVVHLGPQALKVLALLATRAGEIVTREEIERELWGGALQADLELI